MTRAATRDASWYRRPNVRAAKAMHVVGDDGKASACGRLLYATEGPETVDAAEVPQALRCQRPGCRGRWPAGVSAPDGKTFPRQTPGGRS